MTHLEQGSPLQRHLRNRGTAAPRLPIQGSIATPGTVVLPPTSRAIAQAQQIRQLIGAVGTTANQAAQVARSIAAEREREARGEDIFQRAQASENARTQLALDRDGIAEHANAVPVGEDGLDNPEAVAQYVRDLIDARVGDQPKAFQDVYRSTLGPALTDAILKYNDEVQKQSTNQLAQLNSELIIVAESTEEILKIYNDTRAMSLFDSFTDTQLKSALFLPALNSAAENGDTARFEAIVGAIGDRFPAQVLDAHRIHARALDRIEREKAEPGRERFFEAMNEADAGDGSYDTALEIVGEELKAGNFTEELANQLSSRARERNRSKMTEAMRLALEQDEQTQRRSIIDAYGITAKNATSSGGLMFAEDVEYTKLDDSTGVIKRDEIIAAVIDQEFADIDARIDPEQDPGGNIVTKVRFLANNGGQVYEPWKSLLTGAPSQITTDMEQIPPVLIQAYELWRRIHNESEPVASANTDDTSSNWYRSVELLETQLGMDTAAAMISVSRTKNIPITISDADLAKAVKDVLPKAKNRREMEGIIGVRTRAYLTESGVSEKAARDKAIKDFKDDYTMINGFAVRTAGRTLPSNLPIVAQHVIDWYANESEYDSELLTFRSLDNSTWRMADGFGVQIEIFDITDAELTRIGEELLNKEAADQRKIEIDERIKADATRRVRAIQSMRQVALTVDMKFSNFADADFPGFQPVDPSAFPASAFDPEPVAEKPDESLIGRIVAFARKPKPKKHRKLTLPRILEHGNRPEEFGRFRP